MKKLILSSAAVLGAAVLISAPANAETFDVMIENLVTGGPETGTPITPPVAVVHGAGYSLFEPGIAATAGLKLLAEEGTPTDMVAEATASGAVDFVTVGAMGPFFDTAVFTVEGEVGDLLSIVAMFARSNDLITGIHDQALPDSEAVYMTNAYDAGTEMNTGLVEHIPFYGNPGGPDEAGVVAMISSYSILDDPTGQIDFTFPPAARITVTRRNATPTESVSWADVKSVF